MDTDIRLNRRTALAAGFAAIAVPSIFLARTVHAAESSLGTSPIEVLLIEHGLFDRCLLIYDELTRRVRNVDDMPLDAFERTATIIRDLIEDRHQKIEEESVYPAASAAGMGDLTAVLVQEHHAGRKLTDGILTLAAQFRYPNDQQKTVALSDRYSQMMRRHTAREATVLFPALQHAMSAAQLANASSVLAADAAVADKSLDEIAAIEKQLGIYDLEVLEAPQPA